MTAYHVYRYSPKLDKLRGIFRPSNAEKLAEFASLDDARAYLAASCDRVGMFIKYPRETRHDQQ